MSFQFYLVYSDILFKNYNSVAYQATLKVTEGATNSLDTFSNPFNFSI